MQTETARPMGDMIPGIVEGSTGETDSPEPSTALAVSIDLNRLPKRLDARMMEMVRVIATSPPARPERTSDEWFAKCIRSLSILPRKADDDLSGNMRVAIYQRKLAHVTDAGMSFLVSTALDRCKWLPTIAECLAILAEWPGSSVGEDRRERARYLVQRELNARLDDALARLAKRDMPQDEIDTMPAAAKRIAAERGYLWAWPDGRFTPRKDLSTMPPEDAEREREANRAMMAEWDRIRAERAALDGAEP